MRDGWVETTLGEISEVVGGGTPSTSRPEYWDGQIVWLTPTEVTSQDGKEIDNSIRKISELGFKNSGAQILPKGSVILTSRASVGFVAIAGTDLCTNQGFQSLIPKESVIAKFLMFWIQQNRSEFDSRSAGSTFKEISKSNVKSMKILLPPLAEQKRIVDVISSVDSYIEALQQQVDKARKSRNAVLHELLTKGGHDWVEKTLGEVIEHTIGGAWGGEPGSQEVNVHVVRSTEFTKSGYLNFNTGVTRSIKVSQLKSRELKSGDILLEKSGGGPDQPVGRVVFVTLEIPEKTVCSNFVQLIRPDNDQVNSFFLFLVLWKWHSINRTLEFQAQTTGIRNLRTPDYLEQTFKLPPLAEQKRIVEIISVFDNQIEALDSTMTKTQNLRSALLSDLLSGNHEIPTKYHKLIGAA